MSFQAKGTPLGDRVEYTLDDDGGGGVNIITLASKSGTSAYDFVVVQVNKGSSTFADDTEIARFRVDGGNPGVDDGFVMGNNDVWVFQRGELESGVKFCVSEVTGDNPEAYLTMQGYSSKM